MAEIQTILMPKWGLAMQEGMVAAWNVEEGADIAKGQEIMDIETSKIANAYESLVGGRLRRRLVTAGETVPVGALLGVVADDAVGDTEVDEFIDDFQRRFAEQQAAAGSDKGPEPETVEVDGRRIRYLKMGDADGEPVLFIHGYGGDLNNWLFNQPAVAERRTTYALDLPGHGGSAKEVGDATVATLATTALGFLDALGIDRAHLVGHSMGGAVSLLMALEHPHRVAGATLIAPGGLGPDIAMDYIDGFIEASRRKKLEPVLQMLVANPDLVTSDMIEDVLKFKRLDGVDAALRKLRDGVFPGGRQAAPLRERIGEAKPPIQIVWGAQDRILPASHANDLPATVKVTVYDGAGHLAHMEKAGEINGMILAALN